MFKKGVITDEISQDFRTAMKLAVKYKLEGVEIRSVWEKGPHELDAADIWNIREMASDAGLEICGISSPFFKCDLDSETEIAAHLEILKRSIDLAHQLGTSLVRGFTFWKKGRFSENLNRIVSRYEKPLQILEQEKVTLALEFDPSTSATNAGKLVQILEAVRSPRVKALWDPGNDIYDPDGEVPYPDGYEAIRPYMVHMHLKDAIRQPDGKICGMPLGKGAVRYREQFEAVLRDGYDGYVVLETHYRPRHDIAEDLLALPKGSAFSHLGEEATEECLIGWEQLMASLHV